MKNLKTFSKSEGKEIGQMKCQYCSNLSDPLPQHIIDEKIMEFVCTDCAIQE